MKKVLFILMVSFSVTVTNAAFVVSKPDATPMAQTDAEKKKILMEKVVHMSVADYERFTGKKLNLVDKLTFKIIKSQFKRKMAEEETSGFNAGAFFLGFFLGLLGVLGAYIFSKDRNFRRWTWIGLGTVVVLSVILALAAA